MDASAVPHFRSGGPSAAAQSLGARERQTRGEAGTMVDVTAGQGAGAPAGGFLTLSEIGAILKRGDIALALGILTILVVLILPLPSIVLDLFLAISITLSILILMTSLFIQAPLEFSSFPTILLDFDHAATVAQPRLHAVDPVARPRGHRRRRPRHRGVRQFRDGRQFRHRNYRLRDPGDRELRRHHQGFGTHRRSRGALPSRRHARQADGDRRRSVRRPDRREDRQGAPQGAGGRKRLLRRDGRRLEIRARRRGGGPAGRVHQHHRRHHHRRRPAGPQLQRSRSLLHAADRRRRPRDADPGADRLHRGGPVWSRRPASPAPPTRR